MTLREIYQALLDGKKLCSPNLPFDKYVHLVGDELMYDDGSSANIWFVKGKWSIYQEPDDLDQNIKQLKYVLGSYLASGEVDKLIMIPTDIEQLIDLKIKQAKLGK